MPRLNSQHTSKNTNCPLASEEFVVAFRAYQLHISADGHPEVTDRVSF